jgi:hypothetical protein
LAELSQQAGEEMVLEAETAGTVDPSDVRNLPAVAQLATEQVTTGTRLRIATPNPGAVTPALCKLAVEKGWNLLEVRPHRQTLEDLFVRITSVSPE